MPNGPSLIAVLVVPAGVAATLAVGLVAVADVRAVPADAWGAVAPWAAAGVTPADGVGAVLPPGLPGAAPVDAAADVAAEPVADGVPAVADGDTDAAVAAKPDGCGLR